MPSGVKGGTDENYRKYELRYTVFRSVFEEDTSKNKTKVIA
jgi:hypothetical protein